MSDGGATEAHHPHVGGDLGVRVMVGVMVRVMGRAMSEVMVKVREGVMSEVVVRVRVARCPGWVGRV